MESRIEDILQFFKDEGIVHEALTVSFDEDVETCFLINDIEININYEEIIFQNQIGDLITCGYDKELQSYFSEDEISFFHELGHYCDLHYRFDFHVNKMIQELKEKEFVYAEILYLESEVRDRIPEFLPVLNDLLQKLYRSLHLEKEADQNAQMLMKYYLERVR